MFDASAPTNHPHHHACYELCLVTAGTGLFTHGNEEFDISRGDVFIADPGVLHEISSFETLDLDLVFFQFELLGGNWRGDAGEVRLGSFADDHHIIAHGEHHLLDLLTAINTHMARSTRGHWLRQMSVQLLVECMEALAGRPLVASDGPEEEPDRGVEQTLDQAIRYIRAHARERIRLDEVAGACGVSKRNLQLLFRRGADSTVIGFANTERMRVAANDLLMGYRVNEVAERVGVPSPEQFSRLFKKHHGVAPKQYQMKYAPARMRYGAGFELKRG
jgi:AraC-like DNA-binding protein